jgi:capsular polysaccharide transport system ATP-binding protein
MIDLRDVSKTYPTRTGPRQVLECVNLSLASGERLGILGRNGSGKSTLIRIISGVERPSAGVVERSMSVSWPLAFSGGFQGSLTGQDNLRFICRVYNADFREKEEFVRDFSDLGNYYREPLKHYSSGMRARFAFAVSLAIDFDCYLVDEIIAVGDARFQQRCEEALFATRSDRSFVLVSHDFRNIREYCGRFAVLADGRLTSHADFDEATSLYEKSLHA